MLKGYGCAACAYGVGAARVNGHFEHAYPLTAELLVTTCPLPGGELLLPRLLSNAADAPYLGEAGILYNLTRLPAGKLPVKTGGSLPGFVVIFLLLQISIGLLLLISPILSFRRWRTQRAAIAIPAPQIQAGIWFALLAAFLICLCLAKICFAVVALLCMQFLPRFRRNKTAAASSVHGNPSP